jgi:hypothetical protein
MPSVADTMHGRGAEVDAPFLAHAIDLQKAVVEPQLFPNADILHLMRNRMVWISRPRAA